MFRFYADIAQQQGLLSKEADFRIIHLSDAFHSSPSHSDTIFVYDHKGSAEIQPQRYVFEKSNDDDLETLQAFLDRTNYPLGQNEDEQYDAGFSFYPFSGRTRGGEFMTENWLKQTSDEDSIAESIPKAEVEAIWQNYVDAHGIPSLPDDYDRKKIDSLIRAKELKNNYDSRNGTATTEEYAQAEANWKSSFDNSETQDSSGSGAVFDTVEEHHKMSGYIKVGSDDRMAVCYAEDGSFTYNDCVIDPQITPERAVYLIGERWGVSSHEITVEDMGLSVDERARLLDVVSPVWKRPFTATDLNLPDGTPASYNPVVTPVIPALIDDDNGFESVAGLLQNLCVNPEDTVKTAAMSGSDVLGAVAESLVLTLLAKMRLDKIKRRQECLAMLKPRQEKWSLEKGCADLSAEVAQNRGHIWSAPRCKDKFSS